MHSESELEMEMHTPQSLHTTHQLTATGASPWQDLSDVLRRLAAAGKEALAAAWRGYRAQQDYRALLAQPDHLLADVGLTREAVLAARAGQPGSAHFALASFNEAASRGRR
jgi:uncharacterized protein YjiS (DUF1127 family)